LNAEIGLGTVTSIATAKQWLTSTFLFVRLKANPDHYLIDGDEPGRNLEDRLERICTKYVTQLQETDLVKKTANLECTEFGEAMARYSLKFETMKVFLSLPNKAKISEILSAIANASEFRDIRFRAGEKPIYKTMNKNAAIKFPIPVNIDIPVHKILLIIQCVLGSIELDVEDNKHRQEFVSCKSVIFLHATRLIRCIVDCKLLLRDSVGVRNALMLARSFGAQIWDDSPLHMRQLESIGAVLVRKLVAANINSIEDLCQIEPHKIELATSRNTPFGTQLQERARSFPNPRISLKVVGEPQVKKGVHVAIKLRAEIGFTNEKLPETFNRRPVFVCLIVETSDGSLIHFARMSAKKLDGGQDLLFTADLTKPTQAIRGHVMCDDIAGTQQSVFLKLQIPNFMFPVPKLQEPPAEHHSNKSHLEQSGTKRRNVFPSETAGSHAEDDHFGDDSIDDADLVLAESKGFTHIDSYESADEHNLADTKSVANPSEARQLQNGRWACNHACKDKSRCKHLCCRDGLDKPPKMPKQKSVRQEPNSGDLRQSQLTVPVLKARKPSHKSYDSRVIGKAVTPGRATAADSVDLSEPGVASDTHSEPRLESFDRRTDHQEVSADLLTYDSFEVVNNLPEGDYGSELLDNADLPDIVDIVGPAKLDAGFPKSDGSRQECNPGVYTRTAVCKMQMLEPGNNGKVLDRGSDPSHSRDICSEDSSAPTSLTTLSNAEPTKCPSLFVNTSDSVEQASPGAKPKSGKRKASDEPAGPAAGASKRIAPPTPTTSSTRRPTSERPVIEAGEFMKETATDTHAIFGQKGVETGKDDVYEWFAEHFGFEHFNWVG
jgi:ATP-dependent DNA helicase HFM1/MER3